MIIVSDALRANLNSQSPRLATAWLLVRADGKRFAFSSWDLQFTFSLDGVTTDTYTPMNSLDGHAVSAKVDLSVTNTQVTSIYSDSLTERDLNGGLFDDCRVKIFWIDPLNTGAGYVPIFGGRLGEITFKNVSFEAELRGPSQVLQQSYGRCYTLECYADYGDQYCQHLSRATIWRGGFCFLNRTSCAIVVRPTVPNGFWYTSPAAGGWSGGVEPTWPTTPGGTVADGSIVWTAIGAPYAAGSVQGVYSRTMFADAVNRTEAQGYWQYGQILWTSGLNVGLQMEINGFDVGGIIYLLEPMPEKIIPGDDYVLLDGCDKTRNTCANKGNLVNFQGFPDMPTEALALQTPNMGNPDNPQPSKNGGGS